MAKTIPDIVHEENETDNKYSWGTSLGYCSRFNYGRVEGGGFSNAGSSGSSTGFITKYQKGDQVQVRHYSSGMSYLGKINGRNASKDEYYVKLFSDMFPHEVWCSADLQNKKATFYITKKVVVVNHNEE